MDYNGYQALLRSYMAAHPVAQESGYDYGQPLEYQAGSSAQNDDQTAATNQYQAWRRTLSPAQLAEYDAAQRGNFAKGTQRGKLMFGAALAGMGGLGALNALGGAGAGEAAATGGGTNLFASGAVPPSYFPGMEWGAGGAAAGATGAGAGGVGSIVGTVLKNAPLISTAIGGLGSLLGNRGGPSAASAVAPAAVPALDLGGAREYQAQVPFQVTAPGPRPGHTMGPSSAVNLRDPSASLFGYGAPPVYYKAEGGSVEDPMDYEATQEPPSTDVHRPPYDYERTSSKEPSWWDRLLSGDQKAQQQVALGFGALGLLSSLLGKRQYSPGFLSVAQLRAGLPSGGGAATPAMNDYFGSPAHVYVPPPPMLGTVTTPRRYAEGGAAPGGEFDSSQRSHVDYGLGGGQDDGVPARLSPGEYVMDADVVSALGDGSNEAGAKILDRMREEIRAHKRAAPSDSIPPKAKSPLEYLQGAM